MNFMNRFTVTWLLFVVFSGSLVAQEPPSETRDVEVKVYVIDIEGIDSVSQSFIANLTLVLRWQDPSLKHAGPDSLSKNLNEIWHPRIQILNQQRTVKNFPLSAEVRPDGEVVYRQRLWGGFSQPLELREFPFDSQRLQLTLASVSFGSQTIRLRPSSDSGISEKLLIPDWQVQQWDFSKKSISLDNELISLPGVVFSLDVKRNTNYFKYKVILPLILIVLMSLLVFWIDPSLVPSQISLAVTAVLTMIAYRFALAGMLPRLPFLTTLDFFVIASTVMVFLAMVEVIYTAHLSTHDKLQKARIIDRKARWIAPLTFIILTIEILVFRLLV